MNVRNLLADAFTSAATRLRNNSCGMTEQEMENALHKMLYLLDNDHHFNEADAPAAIARMYYFCDDTHKCYAPFFPYEDIRAAYDKTKTPTIHLTRYGGTSIPKDTKSG